MTLSGEEITVWENELPTAAGVSRRTAGDAREGEGENTISQIAPIRRQLPSVASDESCHWSL